MNEEEQEKYLLVIEDSEADFMRVEKAIRKAGIKNKIIHIAHGDDALDFFLREGKYKDRGPENPILVFLDLNLPGEDGISILKKTRNNRISKSIPVIALTTSEDEYDISQCYNHGVNSYVVKPMDSAGYLAAIEKIRDFWLGLAKLPSYGGGDG